MATPENNKLSEFVDMVRSWIPRRTERTNVSRDFWMPDQSCRVCYECDSSFTVFNRRHHCRICGRVFCAKCTANSVPTPSNESNIGQEDCERIRVCNFCFKQWEQGIATVDNGMIAASSALSTSPSATSLASTQSSYTCNSNSSADSTQYSTGSYQRVPYRSNQSPTQPADMDPATVKQDQVTDPEGSVSIDAKDPFPDQFSYCMNRSDDEDDDYGSYRSHSEARHFSEGDAYFGDVNFAEIDKIYGPHNRHDHCENGDANSINLTPLADNIETQRLELTQNHGEEANGTINGEECEAPAVYDENDNYTLPMDFENEGLLWLPPDPENEEDEKEAFLLDDDGDDEDATGEWGYLQHSSSFGSGEYRNRDRSSEEHRKAIKNVVDGHFRALIAQLLQVENLPVGEEDSKDGWLEIIMFLAWEAATLLKPDTSKGGVMDPGGYVKVKCIACGRRCDSMVVKGIVCKKNVAHRRMTSKIDKPRFLILGGALEYQRVSNHLSSFDTLLQQEMDHLKMAVAKIGAHHPNVLLVEKSVSRYAQEYLLAKDISLVLNVKRPLLERIARCTGAQIVPSIDHLTTQKLGYCDSFHVEKFLEEHGIPGQGGKKLIKPLMFFDGCPKPLGCTILLKGANADELKKVKHVLQYAVFAAYHLALETSFLADEGASLPELPLKSPITVALPDKPTSIVRSISTIPGFNVPVAAEPSRSQSLGEPDQYNKGMLNDVTSSVEIPSVSESESLQSCLSNRQRSQTLNLDPHTGSVKYSSCEFLSPSSHDFSNAHQSKFYFNHSSNENDKMGLKKSSEAETSMAKVGEVQNDNLIANCFVDSEVTEQDLSCRPDGNLIPGNHSSTLEMASPEDGGNSEVVGSLKEEFPPSPSDHQSILVSLSTRCVWKGTVCERAHLFRIKYYGSFDKPLGRFLRDHLFDQSYRCRTCESPSEAHVHCYTHRQGTLTISVKKLAEFLPGEREGKIWMWHRCLRCPRTDGFPPATRRVVMSDAAWGLSFGKFLELSFSNHAAASRVASCGHSIHRDCLRFYGFGSMVACFRYAPVDVHSVYLPPPKLEFNSDNQEWIQKEADEVRRMADVLFADVKKALYEISEKSSPDNGIKAPESIQLILDLDWILQKEKDEFEELLQQVVNAKVNVGQPAIDILEINRLRRRLIFHAYVWDQRLIHIGSVNNSSLRESSNNSVQKPKEKPLSSDEKPVEMNSTFKPSKGSISFDSFLADVKSADTYSTQEDHVNQINLHDVAHKGKYADQNLIHGKEVDVNFSHSTNADMDENLNQRKEVEANRSPTTSINNRLDVMESRNMVQRVLSEEQLPAMENLSDTLDAAWTGESHPGSVAPTQGSGAFPDSLNLDSSSFAGSLAAKSGMGNCIDDRGIAEFVYSLGSPMPKKVPDATEQYMNWAGMPFLPFYRLLDKNFSSNPQKFGMFNEYSPVYVMSFRDLMHQGGARLLLPPGINSTVVPVYDDEPTSIISHALLSQDYHVQISGEPERIKEGTESSASLPFSDTTSLLSLSFIDDSTSDSLRSLGSTEESILSVSGSRGSLGFDPFLYVKALHPRVSFTDDGPLGKVKYSVTFYHARQFEALRRTCCPSELDFIRSLSRCKKWGAQGGKSNVFFAKTLDDRFIIKQVTKTELESFIKFAPAYFKYLSESIGTGCPTCLAKILGIYQVASKSVKGGKETRMDVLVMENLLFRRNITRLYDLKGSSRSRYNPNSNGSNKVLLDQNLIEAMPTSPIFVGTRAKRLLERAVWNDTSFLASIDVMDYSLLVGVDEEKHELVLGIIDFMRQYTWDKHLETWVKASGILGGPKNTSPTVISPKQYKKRFRKAMSTYFLMVPDQWSSQMIIPNRSQSNLSEDNAGATTLD